LVVRGAQLALQSHFPFRREDRAVAGGSRDLGCPCKWRVAFPDKRKPLFANDRKVLLSLPEVAQPDGGADVTQFLTESECEARMGERCTLSCAHY
jgi:hypothetical protein